MSATQRAQFDFDAFRHAFVTQDVEAWSACFAPDAEWIEYRHADPPRAPHRLVGRAAIKDFLMRVRGSNVRLEIEGEIVGSERAAFRVWCTLADGRQIVEHVMLELVDGQIARQIDVEAWD
jgi:ketosteroid isomerase-like protein